MTKNKKIGLALLIGPICTLVVILTIYAMVTFVLSSVSTPETALNTVSETGLVQQSRGAAIASIINVVLGLLGMISVLGIIVGAPLGIIFLAKKESSEVASTLVGPQYQGLTPEQLTYISSWSWGAFFGSMVWALGNKLFWYAVPGLAGLTISILLSVLSISNVSLSILPLLSFLSFLLGIASIVILIYLAIKGRRLTWAKGWSSFEAFKDRQKLMVRLILAFYIVMIIVEVIILYYGIQNLPQV
jgi:hypothetical protein